MILFLDESPNIYERETLINNLKSEGTKVETIGNVKNIPDKFKNGCLDNEKVDKLIFHYSHRESVDVNKAGNVVKELQKLIGGAIFIAISSGDKEQSNAREHGIKIVTTYIELLENIKIVKLKHQIDWTGAFDIYCAEETEKGTNEEFQRYILHSFFLLDIDTQALKILWNDNKKKDFVKYLKEMLSNVEERFFQNKFRDVKKKLEGISDKDYGKKLDTLFNDKSSSVYEFLTLLDNLATLNTQKEEGLAAEDLLDTQCLNTITSFRGWYKELVSASAI